MKQVFWLDDDMLQDWQKELLQREFNNNGYGQKRDGVFCKNSKGTFKESLPK